MPAFGKRSLAALGSADERLQRLFHEVVKTYDCTVLCGHRGQEEQEEAFRAGFSKEHWPNSKHNSFPSKSVDVAPYPVVWPTPGMSREDYALAMGRFYYFAGYVRRAAEQMGLRVRQGVDWNGNFDIRDQSFHDLPHTELVEGGTEGGAA